MANYKNLWNNEAIKPYNNVAMKPFNNENSVIIYRLMCLWAFNECAIGGLMHAFKIPFTGLLVGGFATVLISQIAYFSQKKESILYSLLVVLTIKALLSPQSPITAYFAVSFQAVFGYLIFKFFRINWLSCTLFSSIALLQSAFQKLIVLMLFFGKDWVFSLDEYINSVLKQFNLLGQENSANLVTIAVLGYITLYIVGGIIWGIYALYLMRKIENNTTVIAPKLYLQLRILPQLNNTKKRTQKAFLYWFFIVGIIVLSIIYPNIQFFTIPLILLILSYIAFFPFLGKILTKYLQKKHSQNTDVLAVLRDVPLFYQIAHLCWKNTIATNIIQKIALFFEQFILFSLSYNPEKIQCSIFILTGETHSGKTTILQNWLIINNLTTFGFLTPDINNTRKLLNLQTKEILDFEYHPTTETTIQPPILNIGNYTFLQSTFDAGNTILQKTTTLQHSIIIIDELGKLELQQQGFYKGISSLLQTINPSNTYIFIVRDTILDTVLKQFNIDSCIVLKKEDF